MKVRTKDGKVEDVTTGIARRLIQAGEATAVAEKTVEHVDDKPKPGKRQPARPEKDGRSDDTGG